MNTMNRILHGLAAVAFSIGGLIAAIPVSADVPRYQMATVDLYFDVIGYTHTYTITYNPCDGAFSGTGQHPAAPAIPVVLEEVTGTIGGSGIVMNGAYFDPATLLPTGYTFTFEGDAVLGGWEGFLTSQGNIPATLDILNVVFSTYRNHGDFVSQNTDKNDAAHSCIGMPIQSNKNK